MRILENVEFLKVVEFFVLDEVEKKLLKFKVVEEEVEIKVGKFKIKKEEV